MCAILAAHMALRRFVAAVAAVLALGAAPQNALVRARQLYNQQQYDAAIAAAQEAQARPELAGAAAVVLGRAHLERYRNASDAADLAAARASLVAVDTARLEPRDRSDLIVGLGELLYFEGHYGAAAEMFSAALGGSAAAAAPGRDYVLDWWAMALDHEAQSAGDAARRRIYARMLDRIEPAASGEQPSAAAMYWLAAAAAGMDDFDRAWHAAIAAWVRAPLAAGPRATLRADLERLVQQVIIPARAIASGPGGDPKHAVAAMQSEWDAIKELGIRR
jgi:hypothetical protein